MHKRDGLHAGEGGADDGSDVAAIVLSGCDEKEKTKKNLSECFWVGVGPAAAVGAVTVWVVAVAAVSGQQ